MKVISDDAVKRFLSHAITSESLQRDFFPALANALSQYARNPHEIVPPRIVRPSARPQCDNVHLFMPCIGPESLGIKMVTGGPHNSSTGKGFQGCVVVLDEDSGETLALVNAATLTAFRTALATCMGLITSIPPTTSILPEMTVFGAGPQAYWHVRLALVLYPDRIKTVNVASRSIKSAKALCVTLEKEWPGVQFKDYQYAALELQARASNSSIIFGCAPTTEPVLISPHINRDPQWAKFIGLVGSYKPDMVELDPTVVQQEFRDAHVKIIVDAKEHVLLEAGELIQSDTKEDSLVGLAEFYKGDYDSSMKLKTSSNITLQKIVGLSIMDVAIAKTIVGMIGEGHGVQLVDF